MTKPLNPEIKVLRAVSRALATVPPSTQKRVLEWAVAWCMGIGGYRLEPFPADPPPERQP